MLITFHFFINQCHPVPVPRTQSLIILANKMLFSLPRIGIGELNSTFMLNSNIFLNSLYHTGLSSDIQLYFNKHMNFCTTAWHLCLPKRWMVDFLLYFVCGASVLRVHTWSALALVPLFMLEISWWNCSSFLSLMVPRFSGKKSKCEFKKCISRYILLTVVLQLFNRSLTLSW